MLKDVKGFEGLYQVNDLGEVFNANGHRLRPALNSKTGYLQVVLRKEGHQFLKYPHRLAAEAFLPLDPKRLEVNHKDGNKQNNSVDNLEWSNRSENMRHAVKMGLASAKYKRVVGTSPSGAETCVFASLKEAAAFCGVNYTAGITNALRGAAYTAHGYIWRYV